MKKNNLINKKLINILENNEPIYIFNAKNALYKKVENKILYKLLKLLLIYYTEKELSIKN
jgi:hypothetical protein